MKITNYFPSIKEAKEAALSSSDTELLAHSIIKDSYESKHGPCVAHTNFNKDVLLLTTFLNRLRLTDAQVKKINASAIKFFFGTKEAALSSISENSDLTLFELSQTLCTNFPVTEFSVYTKEDLRAAEALVLSLALEALVLDSKKVKKEKKEKPVNLSVRKETHFEIKKYAVEKNISIVELVNDLWSCYKTVHINPKSSLSISVIDNNKKSSDFGNSNSSSNSDSIKMEGER